MWVRASQDPAVKGSRQQHVIGIDGAPGDLGYGINSLERLSHDRKFTSPLAGEVGPA